MARLTDYLPNLVFLHECGFAEGLDPQLADRAVFRQIVMNTQKVIGVGANDYGALVDKLDMAAIVVGGKKLFVRSLSSFISLRISLRWCIRYMPWRDCFSVRSGESLLPIGPFQGLAAQPLPQRRLWWRKPTPRR